MENNTDELNKTQSVALRLETLSASYDKLLKEYNQIQADYIDYLNQADEKKPREFENIRAKAFWGQGKAADEIMTNNVEECQALCAENDKCTGATFDDGQNTCFLRSGMGSTVAAADNYYAIISKKILFLSRMRYMNSKLEEINKEILNLVSQKADPIYQQDTIERNQNQEFLQANYAKLKAAQEKTEMELAEHERLQSETDSGSIKANSNYMMFIITLVIVIIAFVLLIKFSMPSSTSAANIQMGGALKKKTYYIVILMLFLAFSIYFSYK
jgi:hypothetical protein